MFPALRRCGKRQQVHVGSAAIPDIFHFSATIFWTPSKGLHASTYPPPVQNPILKRHSPKVAISIMPEEQLLNIHTLSKSYRAYTFHMLGLILRRNIHSQSSCNGLCSCSVPRSVYIGDSKTSLFVFFVCLSSKCTYVCILCLYWLFFGMLRMNYAFLYLHFSHYCSLHATRFLSSSVSDFLFMLSWWGVIEL